MAPPVKTSGKIRVRVPVPVTYVWNTGARTRARERFAVRLSEPNLASFIHADLKPSNVLMGAGINIVRDVTPEAVIEAGLPAPVVRDFALASGLTADELGAIVGTSQRTMSRKVASREKLDPAASDRAYRLFDIVARAVRAFGDVEKAQRWLRRDVLSLGRRTPVELLKTEIGTREVMSALDRIEFGGVA